MENKKNEKRIEESIEKIEVKDFSLVWEDIKDTVSPPKSKPALNWRFLATAVATFIIFCSVIIPFSIKHFSNGEDMLQSDNSSCLTSEEGQVYFVDELVISIIEGNNFSSELKKFGIEIVDIDANVVIGSLLFKTSNQEVKGGQIEVTDDLDNPSFVLFVKVYDKSVKQNDLIQVDYNRTHYVDGVKIQYRIKEFYPEDGIYIYDIKTYFNDVHYYLEYTTYSENITEFLNDFFK